MSVQVARRSAARADIDAGRIGRLAVRALYHEAALYPKPGLVSPVDSGSHDDMSMATFYRSLFALRGYFAAMASLGGGQAPWRTLRDKGIAAEAAMLRATGGVNTHRGAIFNLGLICAAAGELAATSRALDALSVCAVVRARYGRVILRGLGSATTVSHGLHAARAFGIGGARAEAAGGFRSVRTWALPLYRRAYADTGDRERAGVAALLALIAHVDDTNLLWRGGREGLAFAQREAQALLDDGAMTDANGRDRVAALHREFVARRLSPGGSADLLAVTLLLDALDAPA